MFDEFLAALRCPACAAVTPDALIQTHILREGATLAIGFQFNASDLTREHLAGAGYVVVKAPVGDEPIRLLNTWICSHCETEQWATIEIAERTVRAIDAVALTRTALEAAHCMDELDAALAAEALGGRPATGAQSIEILRQRLPGATP
jgi:hypothetical protein